MKYLRTKRNLENYTVRSIPKSVLVKNSEGKTVINTDSPNYYYGTIPQFKVDNEGNYILNSFGQKIVNTIDINVYLTQKLDDMGIFTDKEYIPKDTLLTEKPNNFNSFTYGRLAGAPVDFYYKNTPQVSGNTDDSLLGQVKSYRKNPLGGDIYVPNLNTSNNPNEEFSGVINETTDKIVYKINANKNNIPNTGIEYTTFKNLFTTTKNEFGFNETYKTTIFSVLNSGWNQYNTSLKATIKKEEYLGVVFKPEVESVVFINRGIADIFERHSLLSEIKTTNDIDTNRGGFIRI
jgi:hypothetical protein